MKDAQARSEINDVKAGHMVLAEQIQEVKKFVENDLVDQIVSKLHDRMVEIVGTHLTDLRQEVSDLSEMLEVLSGEVDSVRADGSKAVEALSSAVERVSGVEARLDKLGRAFA